MERDLRGGVALLSYSAGSASDDNAVFMGGGRSFAG